MTTPVKTVSAFVKGATLAETRLDWDRDTRDEGGDRPILDASVMKTPLHALRRTCWGAVSPVVIVASPSTYNYLVHGDAGSRCTLTRREVETLLRHGEVKVGSSCYRTLK